MKYAKLALQLIPESDLFRRAQATITLEVTHWARGDLESARSALGDWMNSMQTAGNFVFVVASAFALADILVALELLREAVKTYQQSLQLDSKHGEDAQHITAHHLLGLAMLYHEMGEDAAAVEHLEKHRRWVSGPRSSTGLTVCICSGPAQGIRGRPGSSLFQLDEPGAYMSRLPYRISVRSRP